MATSGSFTTGSVEGRSLTFSWTKKSYSIANNTSTIEWSLKGSGSFDGYVNVKNVTLVVNGTTVFNNTSTTYKCYNGTVIASGTSTISHNADGTKSFSASASAGIYYYTTYQKGSGTWALDTIPRYATVAQQLASKTETTVVMSWGSDAVIDYIWYRTQKSGGSWSSWTGINVADGKSGSYTISGLTAGATYNIQTRVRRKDSQLTTDSGVLTTATYDYPYCKTMPDFTIGNDVTLSFYNPLGRSFSFYIIANGTQIANSWSTSGTSYSGINANSTQNQLYATIPNAKSATYQVKCVYGSITTTKTGGKYSVNEGACAPSIGTLKYEDVNPTTLGITLNNQQIVQNLSLVRYTATGLTGNKSATIKSCKVVVNGSTYNLILSGSTASGGNAVINSGSNVTAQITVTDSRGITTTKPLTITMLPWATPTAIITLQRANNYYTPTTISVNASYSSINGKNGVTITYRARQSGTTSWTVNGTLDNNDSEIFDADNEYQWDVQVTVTDKLGGTVTYNLTLSRGMPIIFFDRVKSSVGVNSLPVNEKSLEVNGVDIMKELFYFSGDTQKITACVCTGYVTTSATAVYFNIPMPKSMANVTPKVTALTASARHVGGGYLWDSKNLLVDSTLTIALSQPTDKILRFGITSSSAFNITNNTPLAVQITATIAFE